MDILKLILMIVLGVALLVAWFVLGSLIPLYIQAMLSDARVSLTTLISMRFRRVDVRLIVLNRIRAVRAGLPLSTGQLETHYLAGGRVINVVSALVHAHKHGLDLDWEDACAMDLAGHDVLAAVQEGETRRLDQG